MLTLTPENTLVLPAKLSRDVPTDKEEEELAFLTTDRSLIDVWQADRSLELALITKGIGERKCPTVAEWASFAVCGGLVAALTGKYLVPERTRLFPEDDMANLLWETLWKSFKSNPEALNKEFMAAMLREFLPRFHSGGPLFSSGYDNLFVANWKGVWGGGYADNKFRSVGRLRIDVTRKGRKAARLLPEEIVSSVNLVAKHIPPMLTTSIHVIRKSYLW